MPRQPVIDRRALHPVAVGLALLLLAFPACRKKNRLPPRPDGAAVVLATEPNADTGVTLTDEVEPNDLLATAQVLAPTSLNGVGIMGHLLAPPSSKAKDVDLFKIVVPPPAVVTAEADGSTSPPRQRLAIEIQPDPSLSIAIDALDDLGKVLVASVGVSAGESEGIPNLAVIPGTYFVRVKPGSSGATAVAGTPVASAGSPAARRDAGLASALGAAAYRLSVRLLPFEAGEEVEPNGKGALANDVAPGADVAGFLAWRRDEDWFRLPLAGLPEGSVLSADLDPPPQVAAVIGIYDSVEHKMVEQKGRKGDRVAVRNVRLPSSEPSVFIVVRADSGRNLEARYTLRLRTEEARADSELEPNDDVAHAVPLGDGNFLGYLGPGDVDVYRYTATMPGELDFEVTPPEHVDVKIEILGEDGAVLMKADAGKRREAERFPNLYVEGSVLLRLSGGKGDGNLDEPYRIATSSHPLTPGAEQEPNGTPTSATSLGDGVVGSGLLYPRGDVDYWSARMQTAPGGTLAVAVRGISALTLDVRVQGSGGKELARFKVGGDASAPTRVTPGSDGCCIIQVREASGRLVNARDRYTITVTP